MALSIQLEKRAKRSKYPFIAGSKRLMSHRGPCATIEMSQGKYLRGHIIGMDNITLRRIRCSNLSASRDSKDSAKQYNIMMSIVAALKARKRLMGFSGPSELSLRIRWSIWRMVSVRPRCLSDYLHTFSWITLWILIILEQEKTGPKSSRCILVAWGSTHPNEDEDWSKASYNSGSLVNLDPTKYMSS